MTSNEQAWDQLLQIQTCGQDDSNADEYRYPYEPTPYSVLERLAGSRLIGKKDVVLDYGCGKGRVDFFLAYRRSAKTIGIEYDRHIYQAAMANNHTAVAKAKAAFVLTEAENYIVPPQVTCCYFFNPFSQEILHTVMARILESYYEHPRQILLFFYYPSDEYVSYLMTVDALDFYDEISCEDLFDDRNPRERILILSLPAWDE